MMGKLTNQGGGGSGWTKSATLPIGCVAVSTACEQSVDLEISSKPMHLWSLR